MAEFARVRGHNGVEMMIPLSNNTLTLASLEHSFIDAYGLQYKLEKDTLYRAVQFDDSAKAFLAPKDGWSDIIFEAIFKDDNLRPCSQYNYLKDRVPENFEISKYIFYLINNNGGSSSALAIPRNYFTTFRHGPHKCYNIGDVIKLYSHDNKITFDACVRCISERLDFILLKSYTPILETSPPFCNEFHYCQLFKPEQEIQLCGYKNGTLSYLTGRTFSSEFWTNKMEDLPEFGPFLLGNIQTSADDDGAAVFDIHGIIGMNLGSNNLLSKSQNYIVTKDDLLSPIAKIDYEDCPVKETIHGVIVIDGKEFI
jgi:hypothetical protein